MEIILNKKSDTQIKIDEQEKKYRYMTSLLLNSIFYDYNKTITQTDYLNHVDLQMDLKLPLTNETVLYDIEVKERTKDMFKYPFGELKMKKLNYLLEEKREDAKLIYIQWVNDTQTNSKHIFVFDLLHIDAPNCAIVDWDIKKTQYNKNSETVTEKVLMIPYNLAVKHYQAEIYFQIYDLLKTLTKERYKITNGQTQGTGINLQFPTVEKVEKSIYNDEPFV